MYFSGLLTSVLAYLEKRCSMPDYHWSKPPLIEARSGERSEEKLLLGTSDDLTGWRNSNFRSTPIFMLWAHCVGQLPPINLISMLAESNPTPTLTKLLDAHACFRGVNRPHLLENDGESVLVYVLKPEVTIEYKADMACVARAIKPTKPFVLTIQVVLVPALQNPPDGVAGVITRIEPVATDPDDDALPVGYTERYGCRCW